MIRKGLQLVLLGLLISSNVQAEYKKFELNKHKLSFESWTTAKHGHKVIVYPTITRIVLMNGDRYVDVDCSDAFPFMECKHGMYEKKRIFSAVDVTEESWQYEEVLKALKKNPGGKY